jgi:hypothetical protein
MEQRPVIKTTFGGRKANRSTQPKQTEPSFSRSSSFSSVTDDKDLLLQQRIDKAILDDQLESRKLQKLRQRARFDDGLSSGSDPEFDEAGLGLKRAKAGRSLHEIVEAGENNRFFDEIEYLVDGLAVGSAKGRVLCLEELIGKVQRSFEFGSRMRAHGMLTKAIGNLADLTEASGKARCGIAFLLVHLCHDIRQLKVFISARQLIHLAAHMLRSKENFGYPNQLKDTVIFKEFPVERLTEPLIGLWIVAKFFQASAEKDGATLKCIEDEGLLNMTVASIDLEQLDEIQFIKVRWITVLLDFLHPPSLDLFPTLLVWSTAILASQSGSVQGNLALRAVLKTMLHFDANRLVAFDPPLLESVFAFGLTLLKSNHVDDELAVSSISLMINFVERSEEAREALRCLPGAILPSLAQAFSDRAKVKLNQVGHTVIIC